MTPRTVCRVAIVILTGLAGMAVNDGILATTHTAWGFVVVPVTAAVCIWQVRKPA